MTFTKITGICAKRIILGATALLLVACAGAPGNHDGKTLANVSVKANQTCDATALVKARADNGGNDLVLGAVRLAERKISDNGGNDGPLAALRIAPIVKTTDNGGNDLGAIACSPYTVDITGTASNADSVIVTISGNEYSISVQNGAFSASIPVAELPTGSVLVTPMANGELLTPVSISL